MRWICLIAAANSTSVSCVLMFNGRATSKNTQTPKQMYLNLFKRFLFIYTLQTIGNVSQPLFLLTNMFAPKNLDMRDFCEELLK